MEGRDGEGDAKMRYKVRRSVLPHPNDAKGDKRADRDKPDSSEPLCPRLSRQVPIKIQLPVSLANLMPALPPART